MTDDGSIRFPSITICKDEMFENANYSDRGLLPRLKSGEVSPENARSWFKNRTFSRARLVKFLSIKTVEGSNDYPCNTVKGPREGDPCSLPFFYPDCKLTTKTPECMANPGIARSEYAGCYSTSLLFSSFIPWCYTRVHHNRSHIMGYWGYCSRLCTADSLRSVWSLRLTII